MHIIGSVSQFLIFFRAFQDQPILMSNGNYIVDYGVNFMNVDADKWMALQAIHGAVHAARIGLKYTWFGMV